MIVSESNADPESSTRPLQEGREFIPTALGNSPQALAVALPNQSVESAHALCLGTDRASGTLLGVPRVQIDMQPRRRRGHKALQEQRADDRSRKRRRGNIGQIRYLAREVILVAGPQGQWPHRVGFLLPVRAQRTEQALIRTESRGDLRTQ